MKALGVVVAALLVGTGCGAPAPERVVLVTIDTLRADYVGCYGAWVGSTPTLDGIAAEGVRFETAIAPTPITLPSHTSLLTGLDPPQHGVHTNARFRLVDGIPTLAERFREGGFATAAFVGAIVLDRRYGLDRGFDVYDDQMGYDTSSRGGYAERTADRVVDAVIAWMEKAPDRFFLWVHFFDPHADYSPPPAYQPRALRPPNPDTVGFLHALASILPRYYAGEVSFTDAELGRLLDAQNARWGADRTLVVVTSDHGESLGQHGEITHSLTLYDATQRVPLLMAGPGIPAGRIVASPVRVVDVTPTLLALAGLPPLAVASGRNLEPWLQGETDTPLDAYVETLSPELELGWSPVLGLRTARYKYLRTVRPELYDLAADPLETRDIAGERGDLVAELDAELNERLSGARPVQPNAIPPPDDAALLESLGYVVSAPARPPRPLGWVGGTDPKDRVSDVARLIEANVHLAAGRPEKAWDSIEAVPGAGGWIAEVRARIALARGEPELSERLARQTVAAQPEYEQGYLALGRALAAQGRNSEARETFAEAERVNSENPEARLGLAQLAEAEANFEKAAALYRKALEGRAPGIDAAFHLAALRLEQGRPDEAAAVLAEVGDVDSATPEAIVRLARAEAKAGQSAVALARLERALETWRNHPLLKTTYEVLRTEDPPHPSPR